MFIAKSMDNRFTLFVFITFEFLLHLYLTLTLLPFETISFYRLRFLQYSFSNWRIVYLLIVRIELNIMWKAVIIFKTFIFIFILWEWLSLNTKCFFQSFRTFINIFSVILLASILYFDWCLWLLIPYINYSLELGIIRCKDLTFILNQIFQQILLQIFLFLPFSEAFCLFIFDRLTLCKLKWLCI